MSLKLPKLLLIAGLALLSSCSIIEDCKWGTSAELKGRDILVGTVDTYFEEGIRAEVNNEPRDNEYFYDFIVYDLPPGLDYEQDGRDVYIYGTPTAPGRFFIQVDLVITPRFFDGDGDGIPDVEQICERRAIRDYALRIN